MQAPELFTPGEAVRIVGDITPNGIVAAAERGDLPIAVRTQSGRRLFTRQALEDFKKWRAARRPAPASPGAAR